MACVCSRYTAKTRITAQVSEMVNFTSKPGVVFFHETIAYLKGNSKIKEKFFKKILPQIRTTYFLAPKMGVDLYMGSTYTRVNTVLNKQVEEISKM